jgi:hypothetical protein
MSRSGLHICPYCSSGFVNPTAFGELADGRWGLVLRCPECEIEWSGVYAAEEVNRLDCEMARGFGELVSALERFTTANMADLADRLRDALAADAILPMDF